MPLNTVESKSRRPRLLTAFAHRPQRALTLLAVGAVVGLAAASFGLFKPAAHPIRTVPPGYVALVNGRGILMSDFISQTEEETSDSFAKTTPEQRRTVLHEMIDEELLVQRGLALDFPELDTNVRTALVDAVNSQISAPILARRVSDADLRSFYTANRAKYLNDGTMQLVDIVLHFGGIEDADQSVEQAQADATQAVYQLRSGASLDYVIQHFGFGPGHMNGAQELDFAANIHLGTKLFAAASALGDGDVSDPVTDADGVHVMIMRHRQAPFDAGFDKVRNNVYSDYLAAERARAQKQNVEFLHVNAEIILAPGQSQ